MEIFIIIPIIPCVRVCVCEYIRFAADTDNGDTHSDICDDLRLGWLLRNNNIRNKLILPLINKSIYPRGGDSIIVHRIIIIYRYSVISIHNNIYINRWLVLI